MESSWTSEVEKTTESETYWVSKFKYVETLENILHEMEVYKMDLKQMFHSSEYYCDADIEFNPDGDPQFYIDFKADGEMFIIEGKIEWMPSEEELADERESCRY